MNGHYEKKEERTNEIKLNIIYMMECHLYVPSCQSMGLGYTFNCKTCLINEVVLAVITTNRNYAVEHH